MNPSKSSTTKNLVITVFAFLSIGAGAVAWKQYQEILTLRVSALSPSEVEALKRAKDDAEKKVRELQAQLLAAQGANNNNSRANQNAAQNNNNNNANGRGQQTPQQLQAQIQAQQAQLQAVMQTPAYQQASVASTKAQIDLQYNALFNKLGLSSDQSDQVKNLLVDRAAAAQDVRDAAIQAGVTGPALQKLVQDAQAQSDQTLQATMGVDAYNQYQNYQQTLTQRTAVSQLAPSMALAGVALTDTQTEQLVQLMAQSGAGGGRGGAFAGGVGGGFGGGRGGGGTQITTDMLASASSVLSPAQVQVLSELQTQQQAAQTMGQLTAGAGGGRGGNVAFGGVAGGGVRGAATTTGTQQGGNQQRGAAQTGAQGATTTRGQGGNQRRAGGGGGGG